MDNNSVDVLSSVVNGHYTFVDGFCEVVDGNGNCYVIGNFYGTVTFGEGTNTVSLTSANDMDAFIAKPIDPKELDKVFRRYLKRQ